MNRYPSLHIDNYFNEGLRLQRDGKYKEAIDQYNLAIGENKNLVEAYNNKGLCQSELKQTTQAIESFDKCIELDKTYANAYNNKGILLKEANKRQQSIQCYKSADQNGAYSCEIWANRGLDEQYLGYHRDAIESFQKAIKLDEQNTNLYLYQATSMLQLGLQDKALDVYKKILEDIDNQNVEALNNIGVILHDKKKDEEALEYFVQIRSISKYQTKVNINIGIVLMRLKRYPEAIECYSEILEKSNEPTLPFLVTRARAYLEIGQVLSAEEDIKNAVKLAKEQKLIKPKEDLIQRQQPNSQSKDSLKGVQQSKSSIDQYYQLDEYFTEIVRENQIYCENFPDRTEFLTRNSNIFYEQAKFILLEKIHEVVSEAIDPKKKAAVQQEMVPQQKNQNILQKSMQNPEENLDPVSKYILKLEEDWKKRKERKSESAKQKSDFLFIKLDSLKELFLPTISQESEYIRKTNLLLQTEITKKEIKELEDSYKAFQTHQEQELIVYTKVLYWTSLNMLIVYLKMHELSLTKLTKTESQNLMKTVLEKNTEIEEEIKKQLDYLKQIDTSSSQLNLEKTLLKENASFLGDITKDINDLVLQIVYQDEIYQEPREVGDFETQRDQVYKIIQVIFNKFVLERSVSIKLAQVVLTLAELKRVDVLYSIQDTVETDENSSILNTFENKISVISKDVSSKLNITDYYSKGVKFAIRDLILLLSYMHKKSDSTIKLTRTPIAKIVKDLHSANAFEEILQVKQQKFNRQMTNQQVQTPIQSTKTQCQCTIFLLNQQIYNNPLLNSLANSKERLHPDFMNFLLQHLQ